jgi:hypothetical protein
MMEILMLLFSFQCCYWMHAIHTAKAESTAACEAHSVFQRNVELLP